MPAQRASNMYYYGNESTARKLEQRDDPERRRREAARRNAIKRKNERLRLAKRRKRAKMVVAVFLVFTMAMTLTHRYNLINEKNLKVQELQGDLNTATSEAASAQIEVNQNTDLNSIEAYAKQQLGMKKADSSQTVYIDTTGTVNKVQVNEKNTIIKKIINYIKGIF